MSGSQDFIIQNFQTAFVIDGHHTEILLTGYQDKVFVVISQYGKIGSLIHASLDIRPELARDPSAIPTTCRFLLGSSVGPISEIYSLYASSIVKAMTTLNPNEHRSVLLGIALKPDENTKAQKETFQYIMDTIMTSSFWTHG